MLILVLLAFGMLVGWPAQLFLGLGTRPNGQSLVAGILGSFVGGTLLSLLAGDGLALRPSGLIGSFVGAVIVGGVEPGVPSGPSLTVTKPAGARPRGEPFSRRDSR